MTGLPVKTREQEYYAEIDKEMLEWANEMFPD